MYFGRLFIHLNIPIPRLSGHNDVINAQFEVGKLEREWMKEYGLIWRLKTCFNVSPVRPGKMSHSNRWTQEDALQIADPKVLVSCPS